MLLLTSHVNLGTLNEFRTTKQIHWHSINMKKEKREEVCCYTTTKSEHNKLKMDTLCLYETYLALNSLSIYYNVCL